MNAGQTCLDLWSSGEDDVRIAAFLSVRRVAASSDESLMDLALKVGVQYLFGMAKSDTVVAPEYVSDVCASLQVNKRTYITVDQLDEELGE